MQLRPKRSSTVSSLFQWVSPEAPIEDQWKSSLHDQTNHVCFSHVNFMGNHTFVCLDETKGQWKMRRFESFAPNNKHLNLLIVGANPAQFKWRRDWAICMLRFFQMWILYPESNVLSTHSLLKTYVSVVFFGFWLTFEQSVSYSSWIHHLQSSILVGFHISPKGQRI